MPISYQVVLLFHAASVGYDEILADCAAYPRLRGDEPPYLPDRDIVGWCSPPARG